MAGDVTGQGNGQSQFLAQFLQLIVYQMRGVLILPANVGIHVPDYRQQIRSPVRIVFVDDFLHGFLPFDEQLLPRLLSAVGKSSALQIFLFQVSHVDKGHAPGVE